MLDFIINKLSAAGYGITEISTGKFANIDRLAMHIKIRAYDIDRVGRLSTVEMRAMFGLMRMQTFIITPLDKKLPVFSYDLIKAMGRDTLIIELYDVAANGVTISSLEGIKAAYANLPEKELGKNWYDGMKLAASVAKKGKKIGPQCVELSEKYISAYVDALTTAESADSSRQAAATKDYVDGLFKNGGPSTDQFKKMLGEKEAYDLFANYLFATLPKSSF